MYKILASQLQVLQKEEADLNRQLEEALHRRQMEEAQQATPQSDPVLHYASLEAYSFTHPHPNFPQTNYHPTDH